MWEQFFDRMLRTMVRMGDMTVVLPSGRRMRYGDQTGDPVEVTIHTPQALRRLLMNAELYAGECYMDETITIADDDLRGFLGIMTRNMAARHLTPWQKALARWRTWAKRRTQFNHIGVARQNVAHHYDLSAELYGLFLDDDRQYSCAYFRTPQDTLEEAQAQKKAHIARKLCLKPGMRVLDIGCGWGGMALTLAQDFGAHVTGVTLSQEQHAIATQRVKEAGLEGQIDIRLQDYRHVTETFDRVVSVGMFEHVGLPHYAEYFSTVRDRLTEDGIALIHTIGRTDPPGYTNPWILKYIFPGGYIPSLSEASAAIEREELHMADIEFLRQHYAETLRHWHARFEANRDKVEALYDARFCRMWNWYLVACDMTFRHSWQCVFQFQLSRRQTAVPLKRDYLYAEPSRDQIGLAAE